MDCYKDEFILQKNTTKINRQDAKKFPKRIHQLIFQDRFFIKSIFSTDDQMEFGRLPSTQQPGH